MEGIIIEKGENCLLKCRIQPSASKTAITGIHDNCLKITLAAPPVDGKANKALCEFIAKKLKMSKSKVSIAKGEKSKSKTLLCKNISKKDLQTSLFKKQ